MLPANMQFYNKFSLNFKRSAPHPRRWFSQKAAPLGVEKPRKLGIIYLGENSCELVVVENLWLFLVVSSRLTPPRSKGLDKRT